MTMTPTNPLSDDAREALGDDEIISAIDETGLMVDVELGLRLVRLGAALRATESTAPLAPAGWKPIKSAPMDGSYFLAASEHGVWIAHYQPRAVSGFVFDEPWRSCMLNHDHIAADARYDRAKYWMPLPAAPGAAPLATRGEPTFDLIAHIARAKAFSEKTFGPGIRTAGVVDHIRKELIEVEAAPTDLEEWVDVWMLALDGAWRAGFTAEQIVAQIVAKQTKNEGRAWPDWRTVSRDKAIEHDRSGEPDRASTTSDQPAESPHHEYDRGFSKGWDSAAERFRAPTSDQPAAREALTEAVINAAREAMNESADALDTINVPSHLAAALSLALDDFDALSTPVAPTEPREQTYKEAARYRWLRDKSEPGICTFYLSVGNGLHGVKFNRATVDEAIDAQITKEQK